jgi:hypothetical protein
MSSSGSDSDTGTEPQAQAPLGPASSPVAPVRPAPPLYPGSPSIALPSGFIPSSAVNQASAAATYSPNVLSAKSSPPTAAFAVPLSAVAAIILIASGLFLKHRRKLQVRRAKDIEKPSHTGTFSSYKSHASRGSDVDHALPVLSRHHPYRSPPLPLFMPPDYGMKQQPAASLSKRHKFPQPTYARWDPPVYDYVQRDPPTSAAETRSSSSSVGYPRRSQRPRLPPIATTGSFMSSTDPATLAVLADYVLPSPTLPSSTSAPRCLLPAPQQLHLRDDGTRSYSMDDRRRSERDLYERVESKLDMYRRS